MAVRIAGKEAPTVGKLKPKQVQPIAFTYRRSSSWFGRGGPAERRCLILFVQLSLETSDSCRLVSFISCSGNETQILDFVEICVFVTCSHCTKHRADLAHPTVHGHGSFGAIVIYLHAKKRSQVWTCPVKSEMLGLRTLGSINCIFSPIPSRNPWFTYGQAYWILSIASNYSLSWESLIDDIHVVR